METILQTNDISVLYVTAASFPEGIMESHERLHAILPFSTERKYFGVSRPEDDAIVYRAAAEEQYAGEGKALGCETLVLKKGRYTAIRILDYMNDLPGIGRAFAVLLEQPGLDPQGYCVEWYISGREVLCMIPLEN